MGPHFHGLPHASGKSYALRKLLIEMIPERRRMIGDISIEGLAIFCEIADAVFSGVAPCDARAGEATCGQDVRDVAISHVTFVSIDEPVAHRCGYFI